MKLCSFKGCAHTIPPPKKDENGDPVEDATTQCLKHEAGNSIPIVIASDYIQELGSRVLSHRYRYYELDDPEISDYEYDYIETYYEKLCAEAGIPSVLADMVGFDYSAPGATEVARAVETNQDHYSRWIGRLFTVWCLLGQPNKGFQLSNRAHKIYKS